MTEVSERAAAVLAAHQRRIEAPGHCWCGKWPTGDRGVPYPDHLAAELAAANLLAQPTADEAEGDEREVLMRAIAGPDLLTGYHEHAAARVHAAGFRRREPDDGLLATVRAMAERGIRKGYDLDPHEVMETLAAPPAPEREGAES